MSDPQKTGKTLHRLKIEGDYLDACRNRVWIDGHPVETVTDIEIDLRMNASGVNAATISAIFPEGFDVDVATDVRVDDKTADLLTRLGWISPERLHEAVCGGEVSINTVRALNGLGPWPFLEEGDEPGADR